MLPVSTARLSPYGFGYSQKLTPRSTTDNVTFGLSDLPQQSRMYLRTVRPDRYVLRPEPYKSEQVRVSKVMQRAVVA